MNITKKLIDFKNSKTVRELKSYYKTPSLMEIYGVNRKEIRHTAFLKWLFSDYSNSSESVKKLIDILVTSPFFKKEDVFKTNENIYKKLIIEDYEIQNIKTDIPHSNKNNQVDLFISFKIEDYNINIIIENKVYSNETKNQTDRYYKEFGKDKYTNDKTFNFFVYLTPLSTLKLKSFNEPECVNKKYIQINYQLILEKILEPLLKTTKDNASKSIIKDYIIALGFPINNNKNHSFMAITTKETELLRDFWNENQSLILKTIKATEENSNVEPEIREWAKEASNSYQRAKIGKFVRENLNYLFSNNKLSKNEINNLLNKTYCKNTFNINYPLLKKIEEPDEEIKRYYVATTVINNDEYNICSQWIEKDRLHFEKWLNNWK